MKENVLDVLMFLFENYIYEEPDGDADRESLQLQLLEAGFPLSEINKAFEWLDGLAEQRHAPAVKPRTGMPVRVYSEHEARRLDPECRGFLMYLEDAGVLNAASRELVLDRVMALDTDDVDLEDLKWVLLMVLFNQPGQEAAYAWMENLLFDEHLEYQH